jgi:hypothetical protein
MDEKLEWLKEEPKKPWDQLTPEEKEQYWEEERLLTEEYSLPPWTDEEEERLLTKNGLERLESKHGL